jgi:hypothetical protein
MAPRLSPTEGRTRTLSIPAWSAAPLAAADAHPLEDAHISIGSATLMEASLRHPGSSDAAAPPNVQRPSTTIGTDTAPVIGNADPRPPRPAPSAGGQRAGTFGVVSTRRRRLDARTLTPRDYLQDPFEFGRQPQPQPVLPTSGDTVSLEVALVQHELARLARLWAPPSARAHVVQRFGFSRQYWSLCLLGQAWMGETVMAAAVSLLLPGPDRDPADGRGG